MYGGRGVFRQVQEWVTNAKVANGSTDTVAISYQS